MADHIGELADALGVDRSAITKRQRTLIYDEGEGGVQLAIEPGSFLRYSDRGRSIYMCGLCEPIADSIGFARSITAPPEIAGLSFSEVSGG